MARAESNREDLLREATALVERIELVPPGTAAAAFEPITTGTHIVAGFRADGAFSVFFGADPVYQFNVAGELRRAYYDGQLFKAARGRLVSLRRVRTEHQVQLLRHEISDAEQAAFRVNTNAHLQALRTLLDTNEFDVTGQVPRGADVLGRMRAWLAEHTTWPIAARPNA